MKVFIYKFQIDQLSKILTERFGKGKKPGNLAKHFGKLKRKLDGLDYQSEIRKNED